MPEKKIKKKYKISVRVKRCETIFDKRMGPGIIMSAEFTYTATKRRFQSPMFAIQLNDSGNELIEKCVEIKYEEIT